MQKALKTILDVQELDMQMLQLMRLKRECLKEWESITGIKDELRRQVLIKEGDIVELKKLIRISEGELSDTNAKIKKLEAQQNAVKKVEEFNALTHELSQAERERTAKEQKLSDLLDRLAAEEEVLKNLNQSLQSSVESGKVLEVEINERISRINDEGSTIKTQREDLVKNADTDVMRIYERLLRNKKDRVIVPIENRCCSGCHIMLTAQDENLVRKGERLVFCEHCSRIHFWQESQAAEEVAGATKTRRRRSKAA